MNVSNGFKFGIGLALAWWITERVMEIVWHSCDMDAKSEATVSSLRNIQTNPNQKKSEKEPIGFKA